jgi:hypothetical protein
MSTYPVTGWDDLLGSVLDLESSWHPSTSGRWIAPSGVDSVNLFQVPSGPDSGDQLQPGDRTMTKAALAHGRARGSWNGAVLCTGSDTQGHRCCVQVECGGGEIVEVVVATDEEAGWLERGLVRIGEIELESHIGNLGEKIGMG